MPAPNPVPKDYCSVRSARVLHDSHSDAHGYLEYYHRASRMFDTTCSRSETLKLWGQMTQKLPLR